MKTIEPINLIWRDPKRRSGRPCIIDRGFRVKDVVMNMRYGSSSPEKIAEDFDIPLGHIYAALAYYHEHKDEIDEDIREDELFEETVKEKGVEWLNSPGVAEFWAEGTAVAERRQARLKLGSRVESIDLIYRDPKVRGGRPCIVGTSLRVTDIVMEQKYGVGDPKAIAERFQISLGQVFAALAYYHEHIEEIDADIEEDILFDEKLEELGIDGAVDWLLLRREHARSGCDSAS